MDLKLAWSTNSEIIASRLIREVFTTRLWWGSTFEIYILSSPTTDFWCKYEQVSRAHFTEPTYHSIRPISSWCREVFSRFHNQSFMNRPSEQWSWKWHSLVYGFTQSWRQQGWGDEISFSDWRTMKSRRQTSFPYSLYYVHTMFSLVRFPNSLCWGSGNLTMFAPLVPLFSSTVSNHLWTMLNRISQPKRLHLWFNITILVQNSMKLNKITKIAILKQGFLCFQ